jgi:hypothetical protein
MAEACSFYICEEDMCSHQFYVKKVNKRCDLLSSSSPVAALRRSLQEALDMSWT